MKIFLLLILTILFLFTACSFSKNTIKKNEKYYQTLFCKEKNGMMEHKLKDKTRVDCLTKKYAIEVDWAKKWAEAVGQSLYYSESTNKKAAIALICSEKDARFIRRVKKIANKFDIKIFIIEKE